MNKNVLILGAGSVAPPLVKYLSNQPEIKLLLADQFFNKAKSLADGSSNVKALELDIRNKEKTIDLIREADIVISILPYTFHPEIAAHCTDLKTDMLTASYASESIKKFNFQAKKKGVLLLNEMGLDPGIDHMEAMRIIDDVKGKNGTVTGFISYCGGIPAPEANTNPLGYKFSWSPLGVLLAGKNQAQYLYDNKKICITPENLFQNPPLIHIQGLGELEGYPNRNSLPYIDLYKIHSTRTMLRGTLRYKGWCSFMHWAGRVGLLDEKSENWENIKRPDFLRKITDIPEKEDIKTDLTSHLKLKKDSIFIQCMDWLGFFSNKALPLIKGSPLDVLVAMMEEKMQYQKDERDMIVLQHKLTVEYKEMESQEIVSTLLDFGIPGDDSAMSRTVGLPLAIAAKNILNGKIKSTGVQIPVIPEIYKPVLFELKELGIVFETHTNKLKERREA